MAIRSSLLSCWWSSGVDANQETATVIERTVFIQGDKKVPPPNAAIGLQRRQGQVEVLVDVSAKTQVSV